MSPDWMQYLQTGGGLAIAVWVIWLADKREKRSQDAFDTLNKTNQEVHAETIKSLSSLAETNRALHDEIRARPCMDWNGQERRDERPRLVG